MTAAAPSGASSQAQRRGTGPGTATGGSTRAGGGGVK